MSERSVDIWTCDRCGLVEEKPRGKQPSYWRRVRAFHPPLCADSEPGRIVDLCGDCNHAFARFLIQAPGDAEASR